jgi:hypothetical protein
MEAASVSAASMAGDWRAYVTTSAIEHGILRVLGSPSRIWRIRASIAHELSDSACSARDWVASRALRMFRWIRRIDLHLRIADTCGRQIVRNQHGLKIVAIGLAIFLSVAMIMLILPGSHAQVIFFARHPNQSRDWLTSKCDTLLGRASPTEHGTGVAIFVSGVGHVCWTGAGRVYHAHRPAILSDDGASVVLISSDMNNMPALPDGDASNRAVNAYVGREALLVHGLVTQVTALVDKQRDIPPPPP